MVDDSLVTYYGNFLVTIDDSPMTFDDSLVTMAELLVTFYGLLPWDFLSIT